VSDIYAAEVNKLEKLRTAWQPAVEFLFGEAVVEAQFDGFVVNDIATKPMAVFDHSDNLYRYHIVVPARSFSNDVMLLADVIQEMVRGLYPIGYQGEGVEEVRVPALCEGVAVFGAITAIKQVFGEGSVDSYLNALREQAFPYYDAFSYTALLLADDPKAIKKLRTIQPFLYKLEKADFDTAEVEVERKMKDVLMLTFHA